MDDTNNDASSSKQAANTRPENPFSFYYDRKGTEKDAVALIPVLRGAIRLHNSSVLSLMHPLVRLQTPETDIRSQTWKLHVSRPLAKVHSAMRLCKIPFFHTISAPTNFMQKYGAASELPKGTLPFPAVLDTINTIEQQLIDSLAKQKDTITANAAEVRKLALLELAVHLTLANEGGNVLLRDQIYMKMQSAWTKSTKHLISLPFKRKYSHRGMEEWSGLKNFDTFCEELLGDKKATQITNFSDTILAQETSKLTTVIASMKLSLDYYKDLSAALKQPNVIPEMMTQLITDHVLKSTSITADKLSFSSIEKWEEYVGQFFSDILTERFEIFQSHAYTYFTLLTGRGKHALKKAAQLTEKVIEATCGAFFESNVDVYVAQGESPQAAAQRLLIAKCRNQFIIAKRNLPVDIKAFFDQVTIKKMNEEDKIAFRTKVKAMFSGLPDQTKFVRNGELYDTCIPSVNSQIETVWTRTMAWSMEELPIKNGSAALKLRHKAHRGSEYLQEYFNTKLLKSTKENNIAFLIAAAITHANGVHENAFAAVLCPEQNKQHTDYAGAYMKRFHFPMQGTPLSETDTSALLQTPAWIASPTVNTLKQASEYNKAITSLFAVEITVQPALTKKQNDKGKKRRSKKGGANKKGEKKQQPKKAGQAPKKAKQNNPKVNQPKKDQRPAGKNGGKKGGKGKK